MMRKAVSAVAVVACMLAILGTAGTAAAVDAPRWVAAIYVEAQKLVGLRWIPVPGATGYKVFRATAVGKDEAEIGTTPSPQFLDSKIEPGASYYYTLKAVAGAEVSAASEAKMVAIPGEKKTGVDTPVLDNPVPSITLEFGKPIYKVGVVWRGQGPSIAFNLYRSLEPGKPGEMVSSSQDQRYVDATVEGGKTYCYSVSALDAAFQETKPSAEKCIKVETYVPPKEDAPGAQPAEAPKKRKEYPKLIPIPIIATERIALPSNPYDMARAKDGTLYVAASRLYRVEPDGSDYKDITPEGIEYVNDVSMGLDGEILVTIMNSPKFAVIRGNRVDIYDIPAPTTNLKLKDGREWGIMIPKPTDITQNIDGNYWICDNSNNRVVILDEKGKYVGAAGAGTPDELVPSAGYIANDSKGNVYATSAIDAYINVYDKTGKLLDQWGEAGNIAGSFGRIAGIYIDKDDHLWVSDSYNNTVQKFTGKGEFLGLLSGEDGKSSPGFATPLLTIVEGKEGWAAQGIMKNLQPFKLK